MSKTIFTIFISLFFISCSANYPLIQENLTFQKSFRTYDSCTFSSNIALATYKNYGKIFIENIELRDNCHWNGLSRGYFVSLFMSSIKAKSYTLVKSVEFDNIQIMTYLVDKLYYVDIIHQFGVFKDSFIIDYSGYYSYDLNKNITKDEPKKPRLEVEYFNSLVKMNFFNSYFTKSREFYEK